MTIIGIGPFGIGARADNRHTEAEERRGPSAPCCRSGPARPRWRRGGSPPWGYRRRPGRSENPDCPASAVPATFWRGSFGGAWRWFVPDTCAGGRIQPLRSEEHTSELQSLMRISYAVFCLKKKKQLHTATHQSDTH